MKSISTENALGFFFFTSCHTIPICTMHIHVYYLSRNDKYFSKHKVECILLVYTALFRQHKEAQRKIVLKQHYVYKNLP